MAAEEQFDIEAFGSRLEGMDSHAEAVVALVNSSEQVVTNVAERLRPGENSAEPLGRTLLGLMRRVERAFAPTTPKDLDPRFVVEARQLLGLQTVDTALDAANARNTNRAAVVESYLFTAEGVMGTRTLDWAIMFVNTAIGPELPGEHRLALGRAMTFFNRRAVSTLTLSSSAPVL